MPYIKPERRKDLDPAIAALEYALRTDGTAWGTVQNIAPGDLNYVISSIVWREFDRRPSYTTANELLGVLDAVAREFYRRRVEVYETKKMTEHGDLT
jgi:hypothetical protein